MGGSGGTFFGGDAMDRVRRTLSAADDRRVAEFQPELAGFLGKLLAGYNDRDVALVRRRLDDAKSLLREQLSGGFDMFFGGSVAKHTFVNGLSDVDCLAMIADSDVAGEPPSAALRRMRDALAAGGGGGPDVSVGTIAITLRYADGMSIQLLPAERDANGRMRVPSWQRDEWSRIEPEGFLRALARRNAECGAKLVPTIKLAKAVIANLPAAGRIGGYHAESLAIEAFRNYSGARTTSAMLPAFFERCRTLVLSPMRDSTGQSIHVDYGLGAAHSPDRQTVSLHLGRVARRMKVASSGGSIGEWRDIFGLDED